MNEHIDMHRKIKDRADRDKLEAELRDVSAAIGDCRYMDPPDGGGVSLAEQVRRMRAEVARLTRERDEALPWKLFYGNGKNLGEIAKHFGKSIYDFSPWLTAPLTKAIAEAARENHDRAESAERKLAMAEEALKEIEWSNDSEWQSLRAKTALAALEKNDE